MYVTWLDMTEMTRIMYITTESVLWFTVSHECVYRFQEGLKTLGILDAIREYPSFKSLLCYSEMVLTAETIEQLFQPQLSIKGSSRRAVQNEVYSWWLDYLQEIQGSIGFHSVFVYSCTCSLHSGRVSASWA